jgi:hypothetical protein
MGLSKDKKLYVMFLIAHLYRGGAERVLSELSCNLPDNIEQVIVVYEKKITYPFKGKLRCLKSPTTSLSVWVRDCPAYVHSNNRLEYISKVKKNWLIENKLRS